MIDQHAGRTTPFNPVILWIMMGTLMFWALVIGVVVKLA